MRIRVSVRIGLSATGRGGRDGTRREKDRDSFRSPCWWVPQDDGSTLQEEPMNRRTSVAAAGDGAVQATSGNSSASEKAFLRTVTATGRTTPPAEQACTGGGSRPSYKECNVWKHIGDFWFFADDGNVPTIGILKVRLLESLVQGVFAHPPGVAADVASVAREYLCQQQQRSPHYCDSVPHHVRFPVRCSASPQVHLQLQGALLPDDQRLNLLEKGDHVELCISSFPRPPVTAEGPAAVHSLPEVSECLMCSCPFSLSANTANASLSTVRFPPVPPTSRNGGVLPRRSSFAASCCSSMCGCCEAGCASRHDRQRKVVLRKQRRTHSRSATSPLQHYVSKRLRVHELTPESSYARVPNPERKRGGVPLRPALISAASSASARREIPTARAPKKVKRARRPRGASVIESGAPTGVRTTHGRSRHSSSQSSTATASSSRSSSADNASLGESGKEHVRNSRKRKTQREGSGAGKRVTRVSVIGSKSRAYTAQRLKDGPGVTDAFAARKSAVTSGPSVGDALARTERKKQCPGKRALSKKNTQKATTAITESVRRSKSAALSRSEPGTSFCRISSDERRSSTVTPAAPGGPVASIRQSTSEEESSSEDNASKERLPAKKQRGKVPMAGVALAVAQAPRVSSTKLNKKQPQQAIETISVVQSRTGESSSEESSSSADSSEDSSSSSEEDEGFIGGRALGGIGNVRGRMPAAVARATGALSSRPTMSTQRNEKSVDLNQHWRMKEPAAASGLKCLPQSPHEQVASRIEAANGRSQIQTPASGFMTCGEERSGPAGADKLSKETSAEEQGRCIKEKPSFRQQQEEKARQRQGQQEKHRQPFQSQPGQDHSREPLWQLLSFKLWADASLTAVQPGQWLRVRLLHLVGGMPTLDAWKTVCVEATDVRAGRIKLWELYQRGQPKRQGKGPGGDGSHDSSSCIGRGDPPSEEEPLVRVPCGNVRGKQRGGTGRWIDWAELAYICAAAPAEGDGEKGLASAKTAVAPAAATVSKSSPTGVSAGALASGQGGDETCHKKKECATNLAGTDGPGRVILRTPGSEGATASAADAPQRAGPPLRYLPRRLLSLQHPSPSNNGHTAATEGAAARSDAGASQICSTDNAKEAVGSPSPEGSGHQAASPADNCGSSLLQNDNSVTVCSKDVDGAGATVVNGAIRRSECTDITSYDSSIQQKRSVRPPEGDGSEDPTPAALRSTFAGEKKSETSSSCLERDKFSIGATSEREASPSMAAAAVDSCAAACNGSIVQRSTVDCNKVSETGTEVSAADREKAEWEALIGSKLEIFLDDDGEAVLASHPAAPTSSFHLPLPRELVVECSRRLEAARRNRKNTPDRQMQGEASGSSTGSDGQGSVVRSERKAYLNGAETDGRPDQVPCTEKKPLSQEPLDGCGAMLNGDVGRDTAEKNTDVLAEGNGASNERRKRVITADDWKGFECVKVCARRVVGEQLQHIRRALRRQVDYYFSPENWQRDAYLRSRAVPLDSTYEISCSSNGSDSSFSSCVAEDPPVGSQDRKETSGSVMPPTEGSRQLVVNSPTAVGARFNCAEAQERATLVQASDTEDLAVKLDDIMVFPRMRGLTRDRDFVAWCIKAGGGLHHVSLECRGKTYWLLRNKKAESKRPGRIAGKATHKC